MMPFNAQRLWRLCQRCSTSIYGTRAPNARYADSVARLLFGTCAQESALRWERQRTPAFYGYVGGFSKWQVEIGSVKASLQYLQRRGDVAVRATEFLFADPRAGTAWIDLYSAEQICDWLRIDDNDVPGVLFARLHYLQVAEPVPSGLGAQAAYWKRWYNTAAGKGTAQEYEANWKRLCEQAVEVVWS